MTCFELQLLGVLWVIASSVVFCKNSILSLTYSIVGLLFFVVSFFANS